MTSEQVRVVYIGGMGRSGSTVLADQLGRFDDAVSVGELRYLWARGLGDNQLCSCGLPFRECPFWVDVLREAYGTQLDEWTDRARSAQTIDRMRFIPLLSLPLLRPPSFRAAHRQYTEVMTRLYRAIGEVSGRRVVIDSSKDPSYAFALASVSGLCVNLVHLVRDSRAVAYSWTRRRVRPEIHWQVEYMKQMAPVSSARKWVRCNSLFEYFRRMNSSAIRLRYEDFASDPVGTVNRIVARTDGDLSVTTRTSPFRHSISGNPVRFLAEPAPITIDNAWRTEMSRRNRVSVTAVTTPLLAAYNYPLMVGER